jgi:hypothetical protein
MANAGLRAWQKKTRLLDGNLPVVRAVDGEAAKGAMCAVSAAIEDDGSIVPALIWRRPRTPQRSVWSRIPVYGV